MENQISDIESVNSSMSSSAGSFTECLKAPTRSRAEFESISGLWRMKQVW